MPHDIIIIINGVQGKLAAFKTIVEAVQANWDNLSEDDREAAETVFDDFGIWASVPASYPGATVKLEQMTAELEPFK